MPLTLKIPIPIDINSAFQKAKSDAIKHNIKFNGDEKSGTASAYGFKGSYTVHSDYIEIIVHKKPLLISENTIKNKIKEYYKKYCNNP